MAVMNVPQIEKNAAYSGLPMFWRNLPLAEACSAMQQPAPMARSAKMVVCIEELYRGYFAVGNSA